MTKQRRPIVVTGAAGFIGSRLLDSLRANQVDTVGIDLRSRPGVSCLDIRDRDAVTRMMSRWQPRAIVHLAAKVGARPSVEDREGFRQTNVHGTNNLLQAAARCGVEHFVFVSSCAVYGRATGLGSRETDPLRPQSPYADTKVQAEAMVRSYTAPSMTTTIVRPFSVYGPNMRPDLVLARFHDALRTGQAVRLFGEGRIERDFIHVDDVVRGLMTVLEREGGDHRVFNFGTGDAWCLLDVLELMATTMRRSVRLEFADAHPADPPRTCACPAATRKTLGFVAAIPLEIGIGDLVRPPAVAIKRVPANAPQAPASALVSA